MSNLFVDEIEGNTSNTIDISNFTLSSGTIGSAVTGRIKSISTGTNTASSISSNTKNVHFSNLTIPAKSLLLVQCSISTTGNNAVSDAAYILYIRNYNDDNNIQCGDGASGPYPSSSVAATNGTANTGGGGGGSNGGGPSAVGGAGGSGVVIIRYRYQ